MAYEYRIEEDYKTYSSTILPPHSIMFTSFDSFPTSSQRRISKVLPNKNRLVDYKYEEKVRSAYQLPYQNRFEGRKAH